MIKPALLGAPAEVSGEELLGGGYESLDILGAPADSISTSCHRNMYRRRLAVIPLWFPPMRLRHSRPGEAASPVAAKLRRVMVLYGASGGIGFADAAKSH